MVGRYRVEAKLAEGGAADVYRATDTSTGRTVALKLLPANSLDHPETRRRFAKEIAAISALRHRNIVALYDAVEGEQPYLVMEYVEGRTLADVLTRGALRIRVALSYAQQIAAGLAVAHANGVVHRDLKPANIMIGRAGVVKLVDFGLAKISRAAAAPQTLDSTTPGTVLGTASYMSPEQAQGRAVGPSSDVFSAGAVLYEMLAGRKPFDGDSWVEVLGAVVHAPHAPLDAPADLAAVIDRCLAKQPESRFSSAVEFHDALRACHDDSWSIRRLLDRLL